MGMGAYANPGGIVYEDPVLQQGLELQRRAAERLQRSREGPGWYSPEEAAAPAAPAAEEKPKRAPRKKASEQEQEEEVAGPANYRDQK